MVYSLALAGSLTYIAGYLNKTVIRSLGLVPVWAILAINRLDWSGTSTAGVFAVVASAIAAVLLALGTTQSFVRRILLYTLFGVITVLTKLPSVFAVVIIIFCAELFMLTRRFATRPRILVLLLGCTVASFGTIPLISLASKVVGGFAIAKVNLGLGDIATYGPSFAYLLVSLQRFWLILPVVVIVALALSSGKRASCELPTNLFLLGLAPIALLGVLMDTIMTGNANTYEYFSGPMYFVASLSLMGVGTLLIAVLQPLKSRLASSLIAVGLVTFGYFWVRLSLADKLWRRIGLELFEWDGLKIILLQYVTSDSRIGAAALTVIIVLVSTKVKRFSPQLAVGSVLVSLSSLTLYGYWNSAVSEFQRERKPSEVAASLGSPNTQLVGRWIQFNTLTLDLIATHNLFDPTTGQPLSDFSLAAWSKREFLVLGPRFLGDYSRLSSELDLSQQFGYAPSQAGAEQLREWGVKWFVVDRLNSPFNNWEKAWDVQYANEHFLVVKL
jgi:hypothetical protein